MKKMKSPLRYPGGKSRAVKEIMKLVPSDTKTLVSPFFGGGSIELACAQQGIKVHGYDVFTPLVEFWQCLIEDRKQLANIVQSYFPIEKDKFYELQKKQEEFELKYERAAVFYVLNRSSFSGSTLSGGMSPGHPRFTQSSIQRLLDFEAVNFTVKQSDFNETLDRHNDELYYLDPPYLIKNTLYGKNGNTHRGFDHEGLAKKLKTKENWILSYNNCEIIRKMYEGYEFLYPNWKYGMSNDKESKEIIILSHGVSDKLSLKEVI